MNCCFRTCIMTSTCLKSPSWQLIIISNSMKDSFCNYPSRNITKPNRMNTQLLVQRNKLTCHKSHQLSRIWIINTVTMSYRYQTIAHSHRGWTKRGAQSLLCISIHTRRTGSTMNMKAAHLIKSPVSFSNKTGSINAIRFQKGISDCCTSRRMLLSQNVPYWFPCSITITILSTGYFRIKW